MISSALNAVFAAVTGVAPALVTKTFIVSDIPDSTDMPAYSMTLFIAAGREHFATLRPAFNADNFYTAGAFRYSSLVVGYQEVVSESGILAGFNLFLELTRHAL